ncbi:MAG: prepilin-type N-terminal cleavage/methylation domain-containing protein [Kiritimatiellae bacterium]|nr:prepilin-type N-terminal cleavage/methylation domain-containing protein [Kiritimatiellia bacterium]
MRKSKTDCAFTLVEIMIVIAIVGVLAAIALPTYRQYIRNSHRSACIANLKTLYGAVEQRRMKGLDDISIDELCDVMGFVKGKPRCPANTSQPYDISGDLPACPNVGEYPDHALPAQ